MKRTTRMNASSVLIHVLVPSTLIPLFVAVVLAMPTHGVIGQGPQPSPSNPPRQPLAQVLDGGNSVRLNTQGEIPLRDLVEYVAQRLSIRILYDQSLATKKINIIAPEPIAVSSLLDVLQSVLRTEGLLISEPDSSGSRRIVAMDRIAELARPSKGPDELEKAGAAVPVTQIFTLKNADAERVIDLVSPFLTKQGGTIAALPDQPVVIITDVAENVRRAAELIEILDQGRPSLDVKFIKVQHVAAENLAKQLRELLAARGRALGRSEKEATGVEVMVEGRTNQLILLGNALEVSRAQELLESLDTELPTQQAAFAVEFISPARLDEAVRGMLEGRVLRPPYESRVENNVLIVDSTREVLELIGRIRRELDTRQAPASQSPIRFYKVRNVPAQELLETILSINGSAGGRVPQRGRLPERRRTTNDPAVPGPNYPPMLYPNANNPAAPFGMQPALAQPPAQQQPVEFDPNRAVANAAGEAPGVVNTTNTPADPDSAAHLLAQGQVTVDINTNTIIVVAEPEVQRVYATLIETLDKRSTQVLVEAKVVIIDTSDNYTLGVEISGGDRSGISRFFAFSSYGLSQVNPTTGALQIIPGLGFNGTLVDPSTADAVIRALTVHRRARVLSTPKILVNDNAEGQLTSVLEVPFTSVNASQTVATTSFAGFAEAGTTITVTPTISEDDYLQLDYVVTLNSFTGQGTQGVPPPRQTNEVRSRVTIPDGFTVIVGGLTSRNGAYTINAIPFFENIPILKDLTSLQTNNQQQTSLFVFLKPIILREDHFSDLKFLSENDLKQACMPSNYPTSDTLLID